MIVYLTRARAFALALAMGFMLSLAVGLVTAVGAYSDTVQGGIAGEVIRLHVRANSDGEADQALKHEVKDRVLEQFERGLRQASSREQTRAFLMENLGAIERYAAAVVAEAGFDYAVKAELTTDYFPTRAYGDVRLPAGVYETLRIDIGAAVGQNWWCVMFPPLCYVDVSVKEVPSQEKLRLKRLLTEEEYALVTGEGNAVEVKFKVVELWQKVKAEGELFFAAR